MRRLILALLMLLPVTASADKPLSGTINMGPGIQVNGSTITQPNRFYAPNYGSCTWDSTHDVGPCINLAIAAAATGGTPLGTVVIPAGTYGLSTLIPQNVLNGVDIAGAGGPGSFNQCATRLTWIGGAGGTMVQFGDDTNAKTVGGGLLDICLEGNDLAANGVVERSHIAYRHARVSVRNVTGHAFDMGPSAINSDGNDGGVYDDIVVTLNSVAAASATCFYVTDGTTTNNTFHISGRNISCQYQNGVGFDIGNSDTIVLKDTYAQVVGGGTGRSLQCRAGATINQVCRANTFAGAFGNATASTAPIFKTGAFASRTNTLSQNMDSGALRPVVESGATVTYTTNQGHYFNNISTSSLVQGSFSYDPFNPGITRGVLSVTAANPSNAAMGAGPFGSTLSTYLSYNQPAITFNEYWNGSGWKYGIGSATGFGGRISFTTSTGQMNFWSSTAGGAADAAATDSLLGFFDNLGNLSLNASLKLDNSTGLQIKDSTSVYRTVLTSDGTNLLTLGGGARLRFRDNYSINTIGLSDGSGNFTFNHNLLVDSLKAANSASAAHTINNDGTNTDVNAPSGNLDLKVANSAVLRVTSTGAAMQTGTLTNLAAPSAGSDAATKAYADAIASGIVTHASAAAASTADLNATSAGGPGVGATLTNAGAQVAFATDGYSASLNDRILVKDQTLSQHNGIYTVTTVGTGASNWVLTRATDFDQASAAEVAAGASVIVVNGTANGHTQWVETGQGPFTVDTTPIVFSVVTSAATGTVNAGTANQLGYYAGAGTAISGLTTANNGVLATSGGGVPSITSTLPAAVQGNITTTGTVATGTWASGLAATSGNLADITGFGLRDTSAAFDLTLAATSSSALTAGRTLTFDVVNGVRTLKLGSNLTLASDPGAVTGAMKSNGTGTFAQAACADLSNGAASCSTDATNASNIASGTLSSARGGAGTITGALKGNGAGVVTQAACADLSNGATGCSTTVGTAAVAATGTSAHTLPFLDGANTWSGAQTFGQIITAVNPQVGTTYTLLATDCGKTVLITNAAPITVTLPNNLVIGCHVAIVQGGAGQITVTPAAGGALISPHSYTKTFNGAGAGIGLSVLTNAGGSAAQWYLFGDGA